MTESLITPDLDDVPEDEAAEPADADAAHDHDDAADAR